MSLPIKQLFGLWLVNVSLLAPLPRANLTLLISCPVKANEMLSVSGVHLSGEGSNHVDSCSDADSDGVVIGNLCVSFLMSEH